MDIKAIKTCLIFGAGHGIGLGFVKQLLVINPEVKIFATYRDEQKAQILWELEAKNPDHIKTYKLEPLEEEQLKVLAQEFKSNKTHIDMIINSIGFLHDESIQPEKSLRSFNLENYMKAISINSAITALIAKHFERVLTPEESSFITISAKVGSIEDNRMGGWYSYRASKAALNMLIKNIAIEFKRNRRNCMVLSLHPGTTKTDLSAPFIEKTNYKLHTADETAKNLLNVISQKTVEDTGSFFSWDAERLPW